MSTMPDHIHLGPYHTEWKREGQREWEGEREKDRESGRERERDGTARAAAG